MRQVGDTMKAFPLDWWAIIFNPSMPYRLAHMLIASGLTAAFLIAGFSAYRILKDDHKPAPRLALKTAVNCCCNVNSNLQIFLGDMHGLNTLASPTRQNRGDGSGMAYRKKCAAGVICNSRQRNPEQ